MEALYSTSGAGGYAGNFEVGLILPVCTNLYTEFKLAPP